METDTRAARMKITYATMSAEQMEDLHAALGDAIAEVKNSFGRTYPMYIAGKAVEAARTFDDSSPIDTRWLIGHFQSGGREHVRDAVAAARRAYHAWSRPAWGERVARGREVGRPD